MSKNIRLVWSHFTKSFNSGFCFVFNSTFKYSGNSHYFHFHSRHRFKSICLFERTKSCTVDSFSNQMILPILLIIRSESRNLSHRCGSTLKKQSLTEGGQHIEEPIRNLSYTGYLSHHISFIAKDPCHLFPFFHKGKTLSFRWTVIKSRCQQVLDIFHKMNKIKRNRNCM